MNNAKECTEGWGFQVGMCAGPVFRIRQKKSGFVMNSEEGFVWLLNQETFRGYPAPEVCNNSCE